MAVSSGGTRILAFTAAFNEERKIGRVLDRIDPRDVDEVLVVDDGSLDGTGCEARSRGATILRHDHQTGVGTAVRDAIRYGRQNEVDIVVMMAGNDKDRPAEIPRLIAPIIQDGYDFVQGSRYLPGGGFGNMPAYRQIATRLVHPFLFSLVSRNRITDSTNGFRAIRLSIFDDPRIDIDQPWLNHYEMEPYLFFKAIRLGYKVKEVPVSKIYPARELGYTKMKPITGWWSILRPLLYLGLRIRK